MEMLAICRDYGHDLAWWEQLDAGTRAIYWADRRLRRARG